jgi:hypothetical protein
LIINIIGLTESEAREKINNSLNLIETGNLKTFTIDFIDKNAMVTMDFDIWRIRVIVSEGKVYAVRDRG